MKSLASCVNINEKFLRSIRIDLDDSGENLRNFVFTKSLKKTLLDFAELQAETKQSAYIWTGPYGSGKSSLVLVLQALLCGDEVSRKNASQHAGLEFSHQLWSRLPAGSKGWLNISLVGERNSPEETLAKAINASGLIDSSIASTASDVIETLVSISQEQSSNTGGLIVFIDEMGKFLEHAAVSGGDAYFFQLLAEAASRSNGRLIIIGILHQAFQEYSSRLAKEVRDEWGKIQGRFIDIPITLSGAEQIELIGNAINCAKPPRLGNQLAKRFSATIYKHNKNHGTELQDAFASAWPLNPIVSAVLGPLSRKSYGQNQRSIFSFLGSFENSGFQDYCRGTKYDVKANYTLTKLWDYLELNFHSATSASMDSHQFATGRESIRRAEALGFPSLHTDIIKTVCLLELFGRQIGIAASLDVLSIALPFADRIDLSKALTDLETKSLLVFRKHRNSYGLFEGSDFDVEDAIASALREIGSLNPNVISKSLDVPSIIAKRHYHKTGAVRWIDVKALYHHQIGDALKSYDLPNGCFGLCVLVLNPEDPEYNPNKLHTLYANAGFELVQAQVLGTDRLVVLGREKLAIETLLKEAPEILHDRVARRELNDRLVSIEATLEQSVTSLFDNAKWYIQGRDCRKYSWAELNSIVSDLADNLFHASPILHNELLNRKKPSGSANAALKVLLHAAVKHPMEENLGITKYPAERGLYMSLIEATKLHVSNKGGFHFARPKQSNPAKLALVWKATLTHLKVHDDRNVELTELYELWSRPPFGIKEGLFPFLATMLLIIEKDNLGHYREGLFRTQLTDIDVDYLLKAPNLIQVRWLDVDAASKALLAKLAGVAESLTGVTIGELEPLTVGRALIGAYEAVPAWVKRTQKLSKNALKVRTLFKRSHDPAQFIFNDLPTLFDRSGDLSDVGLNKLSENLLGGLQDIVEAYPKLLGSLRKHLLQELQVQDETAQCFISLNERAANIVGISGDTQLESFIARLVRYDGSEVETEAIAGLAIRKPASAWIDIDVDRALVQLSTLARAFRQHETVAHIVGRKNKRSAMAVVVEADHSENPIVGEYKLLDSDSQAVDLLISKIGKIINGSGNKYTDDIILAALARLSAERIGKLEKNAENG